MLRDILSPGQELKFRHLDSSGLKPFPGTVYWLKFTVRNNSAIHSLFILENNYYRANTKMELYIVTAEGNISVKKEEPGMKQAFRDIKFRNPVFILDLPYQTGKTVYIRLEIRKPVYIDLKISDKRKEAFSIWSDSSLTS